ncbi:SusC/RagA family TonB-linked outer membrane protein [Flavivirga jejuensis]|uniref:SusC/RagA family TonB-linked outer membrane protein n=1 Tax=Flavivirga jejuensis TaxID=870487 RepID=A0ABT8WKU7_9FLAO|nr:SusC/RagA family TonB-linked outer membrane protein [Flavivirga jejuensis]MDO5973777.1 SusC/RagA family TonB-linked outer membrane protein [Flavivirga jejuensis]
MRTALLLFCSTVFSFTSIDVISQNAKIVINEDKTVTVDQIFDILQAQTDYTFIYRSDMFKDFPAVHLKKSIIKANDLLLHAISNDDYSFELLEDNTIVVEKKSDVSKVIQEKITGQVTDEAGIPLPGVTIAVKGTNKGVITDFDGSYSIAVSSTKTVLVFTSLGFEPQEIMVEGKTVINVIMKESLNELDEIIVTGYQTISRERSTGSYSTVNSKKIESKVQTNILARLEGAIAGFSLYRGTPVIRGTATLNASTLPVVVVDGAPFEGDLESINPNEIKSVTVLKDATAASIYGVRSTNGVIVITTKGGVVGKPVFNYASTLQVTPLPDRSYSNLMSSSEFIDYQMYIFDEALSGSRQNSRLEVNEVNKLLYTREDGEITEAFFNSEIERLRGLDGYSQVEDELLNDRITQQHNLSLRGGSEKHQYAVSLNFQNTGSYEKDRSVDKIGMTIKNNFQLADWLELDTGVIGSYNSYDNNVGVSGLTLIGASRLPYEMLKDDNGNAVRWEDYKSFEEVDRLIGVGLLDESYYALNQLDTRTQTYKNPYVNLNIGAKIDFTESLNLEVRAQTEISRSSLTDYSSIENIQVSRLINNAAQIDSNGIITYNIPEGGQVTETFGESYSSTIKAQLNYAKVFKDKHDINLLFGAEKRKIINGQKGYKRYGYDPDNFSYTNIDEVGLSSGIFGAQIPPYGYFRYASVVPETFEDENRYVSFYGNGSYMFDDKLGVNASIRMDQSNLFGTDPKYQYVPLWSVGASYRFNTESSSWLDRLKVRATYGINGNVAKDVGPFIFTQVGSVNNYITNEKQAYVLSPPNRSLRWEKTNTTNFGIDYSLFSNKISGSIDVYNKNTTDVLGNVNTDPTLGWASVLKNYASINNKGIEFQINSQNIANKNFKWNTNLLFSYNKNEITHLVHTGQSVYNQVIGLQQLVGQPMNSLYSIRYAGLNDEGAPTAYKKDGSIVNSLEGLEIEDLVNSGTYTPPYHASFSNSITYKQFDFSFLIVYYGGHVQRDVAAGFYPTFTNPYTFNTNLDRIHANYWKQPGDEANIYTSPAHLSGTGDSVRPLWEYADLHVQKADYAKLRNISLAYNLPQSFLEASKITNAKLVFDVQNPLSWNNNRNNLDPEAWTDQGSRGTAIMPTYTFGINLNF